MNSAIQRAKWHYAILLWCDYLSVKHSEEITANQYDVAALLALFILI
jgi:hypothetical protein